MNSDSDNDENCKFLIDIFDENLCYNETHGSCDESLKFTDKIVVKRVYLLGRIIASVFHAANLPYWATGGTALGMLNTFSVSKVIKWYKTVAPSQKHEPN